MQGCRDADEGKLIGVGHLFYAFRSPAFKALCLLGGFNLLAELAAFALTMLFDGGVLWDFVSGKRVFDEKTVVDNKLMLELLYCFLINRLIYLPVLMARWFAAPLIAWQNMGVAKALFFSFFSVWRARSAFITYLLAWLGIFLVIPTILMALIGTIIGANAATGLIILPVVVSLTIVLYCSFYASYKHFFD
jgi:hypothetical protein